nr:ribonuclease H-like domain, reverse transcriptase, RNA-dependent DNA polymerase [Tanacetum cinerariifolium]
MSQPLHVHSLMVLQDDGFKLSSDDGKKVDEDLRKDNECKDQEKENNVNSTNNVNTVSSTVKAAGINEDNKLPFNPNMLAFEDINTFNFLNEDKDDDEMADMNNLDTTIQVSPAPTIRIHKDHPLDQIEEEVYVCQLPEFEDPDFPNRVYKVEKALYGLHQAPRAWFIKVKNASTPMETQKPLLMDEDGEEVDVHMYRPLVSKDSPFDLVAYTYSDYARSSLDRKSTTGEKPTESEGFEQIVDFLTAHTLRYALTVNPTIYDSCIEQFWSTAMAKTINREAQFHAWVDGKEIIITESSVRRELRLADEEGVDCLTNSTIFDNLELMGKPKTKVTQVPQLGRLTKSVTDEAVYKESDDRLVRAATITSSLEVEHDSGNIDKTQSKATPNKSSSQETDSCGGPSKGNESIFSAAAGENCPKCGNPVDGHYFHGCALLRKKFKEDLFTYCIENGILQDASDPTNDNTNVVNALQEPFVVKQDPDGNSFTYDSKSNLVDDSPNVFNPPPQPLTYSYEFCGNDTYYGHDCPLQVLFTYDTEPFDQFQPSQFPVIHQPIREKTCAELLAEEQEANINTQPFQYSIDFLFDEFAGELTLLKSFPPGIDKPDCHPEKEIRFAKRLLYDNSSPRPSEEIVSDNSNAAIESFSPSPIPNEDSDSHMEEINLFLNPDDPMPPGIEEDDDDSERDIPILEELLDNYSLS